MLVKRRYRLGSHNKCLGGFNKFHFSYKMVRLSLPFFYLMPFTFYSLSKLSSPPELFAGVGYLGSAELGRSTVGLCATRWPTLGRYSLILHLMVADGISPLL